MNLTDLSVIRSLLGEEQTTFKKKYGQNFLTNPSIVERIADSAQSVSDSKSSSSSAKIGVLEIGPGIGVLTARLCAKYQKVVTVEIDETMIDILSKTLAEFKNVQIIHSDILKVHLPDLIKDAFSDCDRIAVCANLPYYITTPILMYLLESGVRFSSITVMVQKEVAERMTAAAGSAAYGALTLAISYYGQAKRLFTVSAGNFVPAPKVDSAVVQIDLYENPPIEVPDKDFLFQLIKAAFGMRRKTLVNAVTSVFPAVSKSQLTEILVQMNLSSTVRGEMLDLYQFGKLAKLIYPLI